MHWGREDMVSVDEIYINLNFHQIIRMGVSKCTNHECLFIDLFSTDIY